MVLVINLGVIIEADILTCTLESHKSSDVDNDVANRLLYVCRARVTAELLFNKGLKGCF